MFSCLGTEGSNSALFRNVWFQCFSVLELKVPKVPQEKNANKNHVLKLELCVPSLYKFPISPFYSNIFNPCIEQCPFYSDTYSLLLPQA